MDVDTPSIPAGMQQFSPQRLKELQGEAKKFKEESKYSDALERLRVLIQHESDPAGTFDALLQFCVCSLLKDSSDVRFFDSFVRKMSQKRVAASELMEKGMQYLKTNCHIEALVLFTSACALYCQERSECEEVPNEMRDCINKIDELFRKMASLCQFRWTICKTFILIHERIMLHTFKISSPSPRRLVQTRCRLNVAHFWFELGEFVESKQSYQNGIEALDFQFGRKTPIEGYAELLEGLGIVESIIVSRKQAKATLKSCLGILPNTDRRKQAVEQAMQELRDHKSCRPAISSVKKLKDEYRSLVTKKKYENAERQAKKLLERKINEVQEFEALLMVSECEMLRKRQFTSIMALVRKLHLSADELYAISEARTKSNVVQAFILQKSAMSLSKLDLENGQEMVERMMKISKVVLESDTPNKLLMDLFIQDINDVIKKILNLSVECETDLVRVVGGIYDDLASLHAALEDKDKLYNTSAEGLKFMRSRLGEEVSNYFIFSELLYYQALALSWRKRYSKAIGFAKDAESSLPLLRDISKDEVGALREKIAAVIKFCRIETTNMKNPQPLERTMSQVSEYAFLTRIKSISGRKKLPSIPETIKGIVKSQTKQVFANDSETSDRNSNKGASMEKETSVEKRNRGDDTVLAQKTLDSLTSSPLEKADSGAFSVEETNISDTGDDALAKISNALDKVLSLEEQHKSNVTDGIIPWMYKAMENMKQSENNNPDGRKASCLLKIGQAYMAIGEYQKAFEVANTGLEEDNISDMTRTNLLKLAADVSYRLGELDVAVSLYSRAYRDLESLIPEDSNGALKSRLLFDIFATIDSKHRREKKSGSVSVTKIIGPAGGKIGTDECTIYFPKGSLNKNTPVNITLELRKDDIPRNKFPVAPLLKLSPKMNLNKPAKVRTTVWCSNTRIEVYYRDQNTSSWECVEEVTLGEEKIVEFPIKKFCQFACAADRGSDVDYHMQSWLFVNERTGVLRNSIFPCSHLRVVRDGVVREMETFGFRAVCSIGDLTLARHDEIKVKLQATSAQHHIEDDEQIVEVTEEVFYPSVLHIMEFQFPEDSEGRISFDHTVKQNRQGQCIRTETHNDRVLVASTRPSPGGPQFNFLAGTTIEHIG